MHLNIVIYKCKINTNVKWRCFCESKKIYKKWICGILAGILIISAFTVQTSAYSAAQLVVSGRKYFIKNKYSGQYLTVVGNANTNGANVVQKKYNNATGQKWTLTYLSDEGVYRLMPSCSTTRYLDIYTANNILGANADIWQDGNNSRARKFAIALNSDSYSFRILSNCSDFAKAITVEEASCSENANVFQYTYNASANDEWIIEPMAMYKQPKMGVNYARKNYDKRPTTYPNMEQDCANFVSQCMLAGGMQFQEEWMVYKKNNRYPAPTTGEQIDYSWELQTVGGFLGVGASSPWISAPRFMDFWSDRRGYNDYTGQYILDHYSDIMATEYTKGDVVQILNNDKAFHTMYITSYNSYNNKTFFSLTYHSSNQKDVNLLKLITEKPEYKKMTFRFYRMT
ncbi:MAG: amidase domain-containing protein [Acutalibacteraceae bacterium]